jgi:Zn-dependent protease with chaperone function
MDLATTISGGVFSESIPGGRAGAELRITYNSIVAELPDGSTFELGFEKVDLELGGASGRVVFCRNEDRSLTIFTEDKRFLYALEATGSGGLGQRIEELRSQYKRGKRRSWSGLLIVLAIIGLLGYGAYLGLLYGARAAITSLPIDVDRKLGELAIETMDLKGPEVKDPVVSEAIDEIVRRLAEHPAVAGFEYEVRVVDADIMNAFALPGGQLVIYTGLIRDAVRPEQVAGVLAHEIAHVTMRHGLQRIGQTLGITALATLLLGDVQGVGLLVELLEISTINKYSRLHETEADLEGVRMLHAAGIDPAGLAEFFTIMGEAHGELPEALSWMSTHPAHKERIAAINQRIQSDSSVVYVPLDVDWKDVVKRVGG